MVGWLKFERELRRAGMILRQLVIGWRIDGKHGGAVEPGRLATPAILRAGSPPARSRVRSADHRQRIVLRSRALPGPAGACVWLARDARGAGASTAGNGAH